MSNKVQNEQVKKVYDLQERTARFAEEIITFIRKVKQNTLTAPLINQLIRSGTSVGSNYYEADCAESRKDFEHKLGISKKEAKETSYWLRLIIKTCPELQIDGARLIKEANELQFIFIAIINKSKLNKSK